MSASASASGTATGDSAQAFMLSNLKPSTGKFVLGPAVETEPPVVVFTGPADHPDTVPQFVGAPVKKHHGKKVAKTEDKAEGAAASRPPSRPAKKITKKTAKPKVSSATQ